MIVSILLSLSLCALCTPRNAAAAATRQQVFVHVDCAACSLGTLTDRSEGLRRGRHRGLRACYHRRQLSDLSHNGRLPVQARLSLRGSDAAPADIAPGRGCRDSANWR